MSGGETAGDGGGGTRAISGAAGMGSHKRHQMCFTPRWGQPNGTFSLNFADDVGFLVFQSQGSSLGEGKSEDWNLRVLFGGCRK